MSVIADLPDIRPSLLLDFANSGRVDPRITCVRASTATCFGPDGILRTVANNVPRIDFDPATGKCRGLLVEEARTNMVANNATNGAIIGVIGSGGSLPTGWGAPTANGLTCEVLSVGTEDGIPYVDVRFFGTATTNYQGFILGNVSGYLPSTTYTATVYAKLLSGAIPASGAVQFKIRYNHSTGSTDINGTFGHSSFVTDKLRANRLQTAGATSSASTGAGQLLMVFNYSVGAVIDFSVRIGPPQLEAGDGATSPILTTGTAATRAADLIGINYTLPTVGAIVSAVAGISSASTSNAYLWSAINPADSNADHAYFYFPGANQSTNWWVNKGGVGQSGGNVLGRRQSAGFNFDAGARTAAIASGSLFFEDTTRPRDFPGNLSQLLLGRSRANTGFLNGCISRLAVYSGRITNAQLQRLTA